MLQEQFSDEAAERVQRHVLSGMGLVVLHSGHYSKIMRCLLGTTMTLSWRDGKYFDIPKPDDVIFTGWFAGGEVFRSGCTFTRGLGKIFYFQPGHEEYPNYYFGISGSLSQIQSSLCGWLRHGTVREEHRPLGRCSSYFFAK